MALGLLKARDFSTSVFTGCETTSEFCLRVNNVFDTLNRLENGFTLGCADFKVNKFITFQTFIVILFDIEFQKYYIPTLQVLNELLIWLDEWEQRVKTGEINPEDFFTSNTSEGLRVTINSAINLSIKLLQKHAFNHVLTGYINQDPIEVSIPNLKTTFSFIQIK